ncbi:sulfatase-like hydrolase/transferase [Adhaeribacter rhizoryzae]|uniref:LTA synthase family protein n=1 Tax=Adhaeribacter rhizoryzae TaxID=2607907 RepID=A0A5M6D0W7_9BACT|nr:sulfatase-like hydrolase/transferase [Adhaeribacter rhizoryzae]KAA5541148.1 LTA synthase family protein [Adhaeribacter rhizoryzae]
MHFRILFALLILISFFSRPALAQQKLKTENVILITLDGFRWRELFTGADADLIRDKDYVEDRDALKKLFWDDDLLVRRQKLLPFIWGTLAKEGQLYGNRQHQNLVNVSNQHRFSYPGYSEILTGFADDERINSNDKKDNPNRTVLEFINEQKGFRKKVAAFGSWDVFPFIINAKRSGIPVNAGFATAEDLRLTDREKFLNQLQTQIPSPWGSVRLDAFTHHYALEYLKKNSPRLVYIAYGETDDFAHGGHYDAYLKSAHQTDAFIKDLWTWVQRSPKYKNKTTLLITTDHGRGNGNGTWRNHGANVAEADQTWFMVIGPDTPAFGEMKQPQQHYTNQVAKTVATLLGINYLAERPVGEIISSALTPENLTATNK